MIYRCTKPHMVLARYDGAIIKVRQLVGAGLRARLWEWQGVQAELIPMGDPHTRLYVAGADFAKHWAQEGKDTPRTTGQNEPASSASETSSGLLPKGKQP